MGFFDRFTAKKTGPASSPPAAASPLSGEAPAPTALPPASASATAAAADAPNSAAAGPTKPRLAVARQYLEGRDLPAAMAIYEEVLGVAGDRADVLVTISGDLGTHGHVAEIIELIAPRYDAERHGPATGLNILQAYLAVRNPDAAQHVLDILFTLKRPELEERLHGFSNAIAEMLVGGEPDLPAAGPGGPAAAPKLAMISISKPIWFYGLEELAEKILPSKGDRLRRVAFGQLAVLGRTQGVTPTPAHDDDVGRLSRALPLWLAETFTFSPAYAPIAAVGIMTAPEGNFPVMFGSEWTTENLRQLVDSTDGLDYVFTGALRHQAGDYELVLRVWEVKKYRERKAFTFRWTPSTADAELTRVHEQVRAFMEWAPGTGGFAYAPPARPTAWLDTLSASLGFFLAEKKLLPAQFLPPLPATLVSAAEQAGTGEAAALAYLTLRARAAKLGLPASPPPTLAASPLVDEAARLLG